MNKLPIWRAIVMVVALSFGLLYTLPNFFGEAPAVQVSSAKSTVKVDKEIAERVAAACRWPASPQNQPHLRARVFVCGCRTPTPS